MKGQKIYAVFYILLNIVGYVMWRHDERLREQLDRLETRELAAAEKKEALIPL